MFHQNLKMELEIKQRTVLSFTSIVYKLMESLVKEPIMIHVRAESLLNYTVWFYKWPIHHKKVLLYLDKCIGIIVAEEVVDIIYFEFTKTFTGAARQSLLGELKSYSWRDLESKTIKKVKITGVKLDPATVSSGIPQGSVLGQ